MQTSTKEAINTAWHIVGTHLAKMGFTKKSKLRFVKEISDGILHIVDANRYRLGPLINLDLGLSVQCEQVEQIYRSKIPNLEGNSAITSTSLANLLSHHGSDRIIEDYGVAEPDEVAQMIIKDLDTYAGLFFDPQKDIHSILQFVEDNPFLTASTTQRANIAALSFLSGEFAKHDVMLKDPTFGKNNIFEKAVKDHILSME